MFHSLNNFSSLVWQFGDCFIGILTFKHAFAIFVIETEKSVYLIVLVKKSEKAQDAYVMLVVCSPLN